MELARSLMDKAEAKGVKFLLPEDVVIADKVRLTTKYENTSKRAAADLQRQIARGCSVRVVHVNVACWCPCL